MKKLLSAVLVSTFVLAGCSSNTTSSVSSTGSSSTVETDPNAKSEGVLTYAEYAETVSDGSVLVTVETYVQAKQGWWSNDGVGTASIYTQDQDGGYFIYNMAIEEDDYNALVEGTKIRVTGYKSEWSGEVEITDVESYEILDGTYIAEALDVTDKLSSDDLIDYQNQKVVFSNLTVVAADDSDAAFLYNWDGSGSQGDDLYFNVSDGTNTYSFTVESYLCGSETDVYKAVEALQVGDVITAEGFLYWYEGANPHITSITVVE